MQIYSKEKIKAKKKKTDKDSESSFLLASILRDKKYYVFIGNKNNDDSELVKAYLILCKKHGYNESIYKDKKTFIHELDHICKAEMAAKLKKNKSKSKKINSEIIESILAKSTQSYTYNRGQNPESDDQFNIRGWFFSMNNFDEDILKDSIEVFTCLNKFKKLFTKANVDNPYIFKALVFISLNSDLWIERKEPFLSKSKNIEKTILDLLNYYFFEFPINKCEMFLCEHNGAMRTFVKTKSMKKAIDKHFSDVELTKKQINKIKSYKMLVNHKMFKDLLFEIKFFDIVQDNFITKEMIFKQDKGFVIDYAHYIVNVILKDPMFSKVQIAPLFDYAVRKKNELTNEGKKFTFKNRCLINLFNEMEDWHKALQISKTKKNLFWDKSVDILESVYENFKDRNKNEVELKLPNNYSFHEIVEINSSVDLKKEGRTLKHCVGSYDKSCFRGDIKIFSLRFKGYDSVTVKPLVTIQINREERITQARGHSNKMPTSSEQNIIKKWANENGVSY